MELIHPRDTQLGRKTSPPVFQVTAAPAAEGEGMKLDTDGAGRRGVQRAGNGVRAGQHPRSGLGGVAFWDASGLRHLSGHLSELVRGPLDWNPTGI